jgi:hypothetical protein
MDWRFVEGRDWELVNSNLNGAGVESVQAKFEELFGVKGEEIDEKEKVSKKPRKKAMSVKGGKKTTSASKKPSAKASLSKGKPAAKKAVTRKNPKDI